MQNYHHTQKGHFIRILTLFVFICFAWIHIAASMEPPSADSGTNALITTIMIGTLSILASFSSLTVRVNKEHLSIKFGYGIFYKKFPIQEITSIKQVKNPWYYGWGIHYWLWPRMWIYNVSGCNAVEINMKNGKIFRIGTDEPEKLEVAIKNAISTQRHYDQP